MEALTPLSDISTSSGEQSEPLDLRKKNDCSFKSPPIKKNKYWFCQSEPLDLSVGEYENIEPSLNALHLESYNSFTFPENSQLNFSIACQQTFLSDQCTSNSKCTCELYSCALLPYDLSSKENKAKAREENKVNGESIVLPVIQSHLYVGDNIAVGGSILDSTELLSVESHQNSSDKEPDEKKLKLEISVQNLATKLNATQLKKTHESFLQDGKCFEVAPKLPRCRECSLTLQDSLKKQHSDPGNILCRFYAFRKLRYSAKGFVATAGFLDPYLDSTKEDLSLWQPLSDMLLPDLNIQMAKFMITHVGDQFCNLYQQEEEAISIHMSEDKKAAWKRPVTGYREMCDVCNTTLFNTHWTCRTCGFAVCIDCYKTRKGCMPEGMAAVERPWLICVNKRAHDQEKLMLTQIIAADSFKQLRQKVHDIRISLGLPLYCCGYPSSCKNSSSQFISFTKEMFMLRG